MKQISVGASALLAASITISVLGAAAMPFAQVPSGGIKGSAETSAPPISDKRLSVHTLLREDIFAGFLANNYTRFARGKKNIDLLLIERPDQKANLLAWKGGATLYDAVRAYENHKPADYRRLYQKAKDLLERSAAFKEGNDAVSAITGGIYGIFADRLPAADRASAWARAYDAYHALVTQQTPVLDKLEVHFRGEILGGLAKAAARTGHTQEAKQTLETMLVVMRDTPYEMAARKWVDNPVSASNPDITCISCHDAGRLSARLDLLNKEAIPAREGTEKKSD